MQGLINPHHLDLVREFLTSYPTACSFLSLVGDEDALVHFQLFLPLFRHINNIGIINNEQKIRKSCSFAGVGMRAFGVLDCQKSRDVWSLNFEEINQKYGSGSRVRKQGSQWRQLPSFSTLILG